MASTVNKCNEMKLLKFINEIYSPYNKAHSAKPHKIITLHHKQSNQNSSTKSKEKYTSITSSFQSNSNQFVMVFALFWIGGVLVYLNGLMLGTKLSLFSYWCLLGYGLVPYVIASIPLALFKVNIVIRFIAVLLFALWAFVISMKILRRRIESKRTFLIMYPVGLFYAFFIGLLVIN